MINFRYRCDKNGCPYVAEGATEKQAIRRMSDHWTARDHEDHVLSILAESKEVTS